jgi:uncharacterized protein YjdB
MRSNDAKARAVLGLAALVALAGCSISASTSSDGCFILVAAVSPATSTVAVGQTIQLTASYNQVSADCIPNIPAAALRWQADDTTIATVDSTAGLVTGLRPGRTGVSVHAPDSTRVLGVGEVRVTGP